MKIKYHNKLEIEVGDKTYVSYNKVLKTLYKKIASLEPYTTYFALGTGHVEVDDDYTKLYNYTMQLDAVTTEISCNPENGVYYVKKVATIDSNDLSTFTFSEIGLTSNTQFNPDVYNQILIKDENGEIVDVVRNAGESLTIKLTMFLELDLDETSFLTYGDNNLIKLLLGEELPDKTIYAVRGVNETENIGMKRQFPTITDKYQATLLVSELENGDAELLISAKLGEGATREIIFIIDNQVVARTNVMHVREKLSINSNYTTNKLGSVLIDEYVNEISSVTDESGNEITDYNEFNVSKNLSDEITVNELSEFDNNTQRFVSIDGDKIAFLNENKLSIFKADNYNLNIVHSNAILVAGIYNVCMVSDYIVVFKNISPYIELYKISNNVCEKQNLFKTNYDESIYSYDFSDIKVVELNSGEIVIGAILNSSSVGIAIKIRQDEDGYNVVSINQSSLTKVNKILACEKTFNNDAKIIFLSSLNDDPITPYAMQIYSSEFSDIGNYSVAETLMNANNITAHGDFIVEHISNEPFIRSYDTVNFDRVSFMDGVQLKNAVISHDMKYILTTDDVGVQTMYLCLQQEELQVIDINMLSKIGTGKVLDVIILNNMIIVFTNETSDSIKTILFDKKYKALGNLNSNTNYIVQYKKYDLLGSHEYEGVKINLKLSF